MGQPRNLPAYTQEVERALKDTSLKSVDTCERHRQHGGGGGGDALRARLRVASERKRLGAGVRSTAVDLVGPALGRTRSARPGRASRPTRRPRAAGPRYLPRVKIPVAMTAGESEAQGSERGALGQARRQQRAPSATVVVERPARQHLCDVEQSDAGDLSAG